MPFYNLKCSVCGNEFEKYASISERTDNRIACPKCDSHKLKAILTKGASVIIKGESCPHGHKCDGCCHHG